MSNRSVLRRSGPHATWALLGIGVVSAIVGGPATVRAAPCATPASIERISVAIGGAPTNGGSDSPVASADGCVIAFRSAASNLVAQDTNDKVDVFVTDRTQGTLARVPGWFVGASQFPNDNSFAPALSSDGTLVAFGSGATNLVCGDANDKPDLFVVDRTMRTTASLSFALPNASQSANACIDYEGGGGVTTASLAPSFSLDARFVAFASESDDLVPLVDQNQTYDVFVADRAASPPTRELISQTTTGSLPGHSGNGRSLGGVSSADGCRIAFYSDAGNLVAGDTNQHRDVFLRDRCAGTTVRLSVASDGTQGNGSSPGDESPPAISADGTRVAFSSLATNLVENDTNGVSDVFVRDVKAGSTTLVSRGLGGGSANGSSAGPNIAANGRFVVFHSLASNLIDGDTNGWSHVFVSDLATGELRRVSVSTTGEQGNGDSYGAAISADGRVIVFVSDATNLVPGGGPSHADVYAVANPLAPPTTPACTGDCNGDGTVTIDELVKTVNIALEIAPLWTCTAADHDGNGTVTIEEIVQAVNAALSGCPS